MTPAINQKLRIIFLGTPNFAVPILHSLINSEFRPTLIITQPDKPAGRKMKLNPSPIKEYAREYDLKVLQPENRKELAEIIEKYQPDLCILVAFGMIIPDNLLSLPRLGWLNIHPSLLPKHRGSSPVQAAILKGDKQTGVSIIKLNERVDAGPIVSQIETEISDHDNTEALSKKLAELGAKILVDILPDYSAGIVKLHLQDESQATYSGIIERTQGQINWQKSAKEIERQFRAFYPWPGVFTYLAGKRLKIANLSLLGGDFDAKLAPGEAFLGPKGSLAVKCKDGAISLETVQLEGKKEVSGIEFLRGQKNIVGSVLK